jgi:hypothetical protein
VTERVTLAVLLEMIGQDREVIELLRECDLVAAEADTFGGDEVEHALVARTLLRELDVNPPGVEIILRLRRELLATRRQVGDLLRELAALGLTSR